MCCQPSHTEVKTQTPQCGRPCQSLPKGEGSPSEPTIRETEEILFPHSHHTPRGPCPQTDKNTAFVARQSRLQNRFLIWSWISATLRAAEPVTLSFPRDRLNADISSRIRMYALTQGFQLLFICLRSPLNIKNADSTRKKCSKKIEEKKKKNYMGTTGNNWPGMFWSNFDSQRALIYTCRASLAVR